MVPLHPQVHVPTMMEIAIAVTVAAREHGYDVLLLAAVGFDVHDKRRAGS
ncbi:hypothetical protein [Streptomyces vietnamensis]